MVLITGPKYAGKRTYVREHYPDARVSAGAEEWVKNKADADAAFRKMCDYDVVILPEVGSGVVPMDPLENERREAIGYLAQRLAKEADTVIRIICGLPQIIK